MKGDRQCKKQISRTIQVCQRCIKSFYRSCAQIHKVYNSSNELMTCLEKILERESAGGIAGSVLEGGVFDGSGPADDGVGLSDIITSRAIQEMIQRVD